MTEQIKKLSVCTKDDTEPVTLIETEPLETIDGYVKLEAVKESKQVLLKIQQGKGENILDFGSLKFRIEEFEEFVKLVNEILKEMKA